MDNRIENLFENIKKIAGITFYPCDLKETVFSGERVFQDGNATYLKAGKYVYKTDGAGEKEFKYALLIVAAAESFCKEKKTPSGNELFRDLLSGRANDEETEKIKARQTAVSGRGIVLKIVFSAEKKEEISDFLNNYVGAEETLCEISDGEIAIFKSLINGKDDAATAGVYAKVLSQSVFEETGEKVTVGVGGETDSAEDIRRSYAQAAAAVSLSKKTGACGEVFFYRDFAFYNILKEQPRVKALGILSDILSDGGLKVFYDEELMRTAEVFLKRDLNLSETARELYVHRNTLIYRLDRIERITGLNIRNFKDAFTFKTAKTLFDLSKDGII